MSYAVEEAAWVAGHEESSKAWPRSLNQAGFCMGIVEGALWSLPRTDFCLPKYATTGQGLKVLVKYTDDHPEELHERTALLAAGAFVKAWRARMTQRNPP